MYQLNASNTSNVINLTTPLSIHASFQFPLQNEIARREVLVGGLWLLLPGIGWLLNMGHRIMMVHNMMHGRSAWPAWSGYGALLRHGLVTFLGMLFYYLPAALIVWAGLAQSSLPLLAAAGLFAVAATVAIPGYMSHYCVQFDPREVFDPTRALRRCLQAGRAYWHAWLIALAALVLSFTGLLLAGVGFLATSVWFWQVAGFSFATVMTQQFRLSQDGAAADAVAAVHAS